jgi:hypothetical protein
VSHDRDERDDTDDRGGHGDAADRDERDDAADRGEEIVKTTTEEAHGAAVPASPVPATVTVTVLVDNAQGGEGLRSQWGL